MRKIFNVIQFFWQKLKLLFSFSNTENLCCLSTNTTRELRKLNHSCALTSLSIVMPNLSYDDISDAFYNCCEEWPGDGVKHNEFNVVLRYLNVFDNFIYTDHSKSKIKFSDFINKKGTYILLIPGHYTVLCNGKIYDNYGYENLSGNTKIYCSWRLSTGK